MPIPIPLHLEVSSRSPSRQDGDRTSNDFPLILTTLSIKRSAMLINQPERTTRERVERGQIPSIRRGCERRVRFVDLLRFIVDAGNNYNVKPHVLKMKGPDAPLMTVAEVARDLNRAGLRGGQRMIRLRADQGLLPGFKLPAFTQDIDKRTQDGKSHAGKRPWLFWRAHIAALVAAAEMNAAPVEPTISSAIAVEIGRRGKTFLANAAMITGSTILD